MPLGIGTNIAALQAERQLAQNSNNLSRVYERLASGARINHASDDPAGLAIADSLRSDAQIYSQSVRNANDAISMLSVSEGALHQLSDLVIRITELAEQSANGVYSSVQRQATDREAQALGEEFSRIISTTSFNGIKLLDGSADVTSVQVGVNGSVSSRIDVPSAAVTTSNTSSTQTTTGTGQLSAPVQYDTLATRASQVISGDFNEDGSDDLVVTTDSGGGFSLLLSNGNGTFLPSLIDADTPNNSYPVSNAVDVNHDGHLDMVDTVAGGSRVIYLGNGDGTFSAQTIDGVATATAYSLVDVNNDNNIDLVSTIANLHKFTVRLGNGDGTFKGPTTFTTPVGQTFDLIAATSDFNGDGYVDYISTDATHGYLMLNNGNGTFGAAALISNESPQDCGDVDGDGKIDLIASDGNNLFPPLPSISQRRKRLRRKQRLTVVGSVITIY